MRLGKPTIEPPPGRRDAARGKYNKIYEAISKLAPSEWLPVLFDTDKDAYNFRVAASTSRRYPLEARLRGSAVYVRIKRENGGKSKGEK